MNTSSIHLQRQRGAVLVISLMLLIILTMLGISALDSTKLETKMAANVAEMNRALQAAEIGLKQPLSYPKAELVKIASYSDTFAMNPAYSKYWARYYKFDTNKNLIFNNNASDSSADYSIKVTTLRSSGSYPDLSGKLRCPGNCVIHFVIESTGRSREDTAAATVKLKGGMALLVPANKSGGGGLKEGICRTEDRSIGDFLADTSDCFQ